jgi:hypothetical protein
LRDQRLVSSGRSYQKVKIEHLRQLKRVFGTLTTTLGRKKRSTSAVQRSQ